LRVDGETISLAPPPCVDVDLWQFRRDLEEAETALDLDDSAGVVGALERAAARWRGDPFADLDAIGELDGAVEEIRRVVAGRFADAAAWAERVKRASPFDERAHRLAIAAQLQRGDRAAVSGAVAAARQMLDSLGVQPEAGTQMLFRQATERLGRHGSAA
jgi:DNA-binding SARP family transcriptional activator